MTNAAGFPDYLINRLVPVNTGTPDQLGCFWFYQAINGWAAPDSRATMLPLISLGGEVAADVQYRGRSIGLKGWVECPSETARQNARLLLTRAMNVLASPGLFVAREAVQRYCNFVHAGNSSQGRVAFDETGRGIKAAAESIATTANRQVVNAAFTSGSTTVTSATIAFVAGDVGKPAWALGGYLPVGATIASVTNSTTAVLSVAAVASGSSVTFGVGAPGGLAAGTVAYTADWEVEMYSQDPRKLAVVGATASFSGGAASATGAGTVEAYPLVTLTTGAADPITLTNVTTGLALVLDRLTDYPAMPATVVVDFENKTIVDGSGNNRYDLRDLTTPWWTIQPGPNSLTVSPTMAGTIAWHDAWI